VTDASLLDPARVAPEPANPAVADLMRDEVVFCLPSTPVDAVAKLMSDNDINEVVVLTMTVVKPAAAKGFPIASTLVLNRYTSLSSL